MGLHQVQAGGGEGVLSDQGLLMQAQALFGFWVVQFLLLQGGWKDALGGAGVY